jgi:hypothetical protein
MMDARNAKSPAGRRRYQTIATQLRLVEDRTGTFFRYAGERSHYCDRHVFAG